MKRLPKPKHKLGYTAKEVFSICKKLDVDILKFNRAFGVNTCGVIKGEVIYYVCDVERALWVLGCKFGKYHSWD